MFFLWPQTKNFDKLYKMNIQKTLTALGIAFVLLLFQNTEANSQAIHQTSALFKVSVRQECYERYGLNPGCGEPLETWLRLYDILQGCQRVDGKMCARAEAAFNLYAGKPLGTDSFGLCNLGVAQYVVPQLIAFQDYDTGWKYPTLTASIEAHIVAGKATMRDYIKSVEFNYYVETFHRALLGLPPAVPPKPPIFRIIP